MPFLKLSILSDPRAARLRPALAAAVLTFLVGSCAPALVEQAANRSVPTAYATAPAAATPDTTNAGRSRWQTFFADPYLRTLIEAALANNQELNITRQEIEIARAEVRARKGEYLPFVGLGGRAALDRVSRTTIQGATEDNINIREGQRTPDPLPGFQVGAVASWEVDIWRRLRNARQAATNRYLATIEGRNFLVTNLVAEIASAYYELLALDNQLALVQQNIGIQTNALELVRLQKESARVTELAVRRFEAQVLHTTALQFGIQQRIVETENHLNFLCGRFSQPVARAPDAFVSAVPAVVAAGVPVQLLQNRPDVRQAEQNLTAANLDVRVARAAFYPALRLDGAIGVGSFRPSLLLRTPESLLFGLGADLMAPLFNRNGLKAGFAAATARQSQAVYQYQRAVLTGYLEVANQIASISNLARAYDAKTREVAALTTSVEIAGNLFQSARADYTEVLITQRDALEARFDLIDTRLQQLTAAVSVYRALGGGWQ